MSRINTILEMLKKNPDDVFLHYAIAMEHISVNAFADAIEKLEWIKSHYSDYLPLYYQLAQLYSESGNTENAIKTYEEGIILAENLSEKKTASELRSALEELIY